MSESRGLILLLTEVSTFLDQMRKEVLAGRVFVDSNESGDMLALAVKEQAKTIDLLLTGLGKTVKQVNEIIATLEARQQNCKYHPDRKAIINYGGELLCADCYEPNRHGVTKRL